MPVRARGRRRGQALGAPETGGICGRMGVHGRRRSAGRAVREPAGAGLPAGGVTGRFGVLQAGRSPGPYRVLPGGSPHRGSSSAVLRAPRRKPCGEAGVDTRTYPRHARRWGAGRWAGRLAGPGRLRPPADREAPRPPARHDPLVHPVAITEHCVIGDQIRVPAARCDMVGCVAGFADPVALGEAHNRARALAAGWGEDAFGRLVCPACQQRYRVAPARRDLRQRGTATDRATAEAVAGPGGGVGQSARSIAARWHRAVSPGQHRRTPSPHLLLGPASDPNGWTAPHQVPVPAAGKAPDEPGRPAVGHGAARHAGRRRPALPPRLSPGRRSPGRAASGTAHAAPGS
jgi:hypothetical protein